MFLFAVYCFLSQSSVVPEMRYSRNDCRRGLLDVRAFDVRGAGNVVVTLTHGFVDIAVGLLDELPFVVVDADYRVLVILDDYTVNVVESDYMFVGFLALQCVRSENVAFIIGY